MPSSRSTEIQAREKMTFRIFAQRTMMFALAGALFLAPRCNAQQIAASSSDAASAALPDAPMPTDQPAVQTPAAQGQPASSQGSSSAPNGGQTKRILGIIPNFRAVDSNQHLPPQTVKDKFVTATQDSFDYSSLAVPALVAVYDYERNNTPEFGSGGVGYGRYLWHSVVDQTSENYFVEFIVPAATHEDTRFYTLGSGSFTKRAGYALSRVVITRSDSGQRTFNYGEVLGAGMAAGLSNAYYPSRERSFSNTGSQWGISVAIDAASFMLKEFWPDINHGLFHQSVTPAASSPATHP
jgi:hypothetical protein